MGDIFRSSALTIVAASAESCKQGFLEDRLPIQCPLNFPSGVSTWGKDVKNGYLLGKVSRQLYSAFQMSYLCTDGSLGSVYLHESDFEQPQDPLYTRAWTLQETTLSPRTLIYSSNQLFWKCRTRFHADGGYMDWNGFSGFSVPKMSQLRLGSKDGFSKPTDEYRLVEHKVVEEWRLLAGSYSGMALSFPRDKLSALSGLVSEFHKVIGCEYLAGLWRARLIEDLTWRRANGSTMLVPRIPQGSRTSRPAVWRCPSFSWMAIDGSVSWGSMGTCVAEIEECSVTPLSELNPFGEVIDGFLKINGPMGEVTVQPAPNPRRTLDESAYGDVLFSPNFKGSVQRSLGWVLLDVPGEIEELAGKSLWILTMISIRHEGGWGRNRRRNAPPPPDIKPLEFHGLVLQSVGDSFQRVGYYIDNCDTDASNWFQQCSRKSIIVR
jgi:hypothetical protein